MSLRTALERDSYVKMELSDTFQIHLHAFSYVKLKVSDSFQIHLNALSYVKCTFQIRFRFASYQSERVPQSKSRISDFQDFGKLKLLKSETEI